AQSGDRPVHARCPGAGAVRRPGPGRVGRRGARGPRHHPCRGHAQDGGALAHARRGPSDDRQGHQRVARHGEARRRDPRRQDGQRQLGARQAAPAGLRARHPAHPDGDRGGSRPHRLPRAHRPARLLPDGPGPGADLPDGPRLDRGHGQRPAHRPDDGPHHARRGGGPTGGPAARRGGPHHTGPADGHLPRAWHHQRRRRRHGTGPADAEPLGRSARGQPDPSGRGPGHRLGHRRLRAGADGAGRRRQLVVRPVVEDRRAGDRGSAATARSLHVDGRFGEVPHHRRAPGGSPADLGRALRGLRHDAGDVPRGDPHAAQRCHRRGHPARHALARCPADDGQAREGAGRVRVQHGVLLDVADLRRQATGL
ncbi:MAG: hypothetical protein AVDCRST_MAG32-2956, partial [uncultured Nocardioides sp.]